LLEGECGAGLVLPRIIIGNGMEKVDEVPGGSLRRRADSR